MTGREAVEAGFEERVRESFSRQEIMRTLGATLERVESGLVEIHLPFRKELTQQHGFLHAGIVATILDSACGFAAFTQMPPDAAVLSIEYKINLLAPAVGEKIIARGRLIRYGQTITVTEGDALAISQGSERPVAHMVATMMTVRGRDELVG